MGFGVGVYEYDYEHAAESSLFNIIRLDIMTEG